MIDLFFSPLKAITHAKQSKNFAYTFLLLLLASVASFLSTLVITKSLAVKVVLFALLSLVSSLLGTLVVALFFWIAMRLLTEKGGYYDALTLVTYPLFVGSVGFLVASLLGLIPYAGPVLMGLLLVFVFVLSQALLFKLGMELYDIDAVTMMIGLTMVYMAILLGVYATAVKVLYFDGFMRLAGMLA
jgi:hypothetical protein